jgi:alanyl-tRNA synthetase
MVTQVPVGGVDNFNPTGAGWKVESVFKMTAEQTKAVDALRDEYAAEQKKFNQEVLDAEKVLADKATKLRQAYEKKANDVLTGADKEAKEKMDALAAEIEQKNAATVTETLPLFDLNDNQQAFAMMRALRDKTGKVLQEGEDKLVELVPTENRAKLQDALKQQADLRNRANQFNPGGPGGNNQGGGMRGRGGPGGGGNQEAVKPPKPAETDKF